MPGPTPTPQANTQNPSVLLTRALAGFTRLENQYIRARNVLFKNYDIYLNNATVSQYNARETGLSLYATIKYAQTAYTYYRQVIESGNLNQEEIQAFNAAFKGFSDQCTIDHIDYMPAAPQLLYFPNQTDPVLDIPALVGKIPLLGAYIGGFTKMVKGVLGQYPQVIFDQSGNGGMMTYTGRLYIDVSMLNAPTSLDVLFHEGEHYDDFLCRGLADKPLNVPQLDVVIPTYVLDAPNDSQVLEDWADLGAAFIEAIGRIPSSFVYTRWVDQGTLEDSAQSHPNGDSRGQMKEDAVTVFRAHFKQNKFPNNRWKAFADDVRARSNLRWNQAPSFGDMDVIAKNSPGDIAKQLAEFQKKFPEIFSPDAQGQLPPPVMATYNLCDKIKALYTGQPLPKSSFDAKTIPLISLTTFQASCPVSMLNPRPSLLTNSVSTLPSLGTPTTMAKTTQSVNNPVNNQVPINTNPPLAKTVTPIVNAQNSVLPPAPKTQTVSSIPASPIITNPRAMPPVSAPLSTSAPLSPQRQAMPPFVWPTTTTSAVPPMPANPFASPIANTQAVLPRSPLPIVHQVTGRSSIPSLPQGVSNRALGYQAENGPVGISADAPDINGTLVGLPVLTHIGEKAFQTGFKRWIVAYNNATRIDDTPPNTTAPTNAAPANAKAGKKTLRAGGC